MEVSQRAIQTGEVVIRRTFIVTAVKLFTPFIACLKIVYRPIRSNRLSSKINIISYNNWFNKCTDFMNSAFLTFSEIMASNYFLKTLLQ